MGGLTTAYILQKNGCEVTVLEQGAQIGGCLQCFMRKGVKFETGMHFIGSADKGQIMDQMMEYFGLHGNVSLSALDPERYNVIRIGGDSFEYPVGREAFMERMGGYFPHQKDSLAQYLDAVDKVCAASSVEAILGQATAHNLDTEYHSRSIDDVLGSLISDPLLKDVLMGDSPLYGAVKDRTPFSLHAFIMDFYNRSAYRFEGGSDAVAFSLEGSIKDMGGKVFTSKKVVRILCNDTEAYGVECADGEVFAADYVISTVHPSRLMEMLDTPLIRPAFRKRIASIPQSPGVFALYTSFKDGCMPYMNHNSFGADNDGRYLYMHMCHKDRAEWARSGVVLEYMDISQVQQWAGTGIGRRGVDYEEFKKAKAQELIRRIDAAHPGFASSIKDFYTSTPLTYVDYTGTEDGGIYGIAHDITLGPAGRVPSRTRIPNLLLAGQNVNSHGMLGVIVGSFVACSAIVSPDILYRQFKR